ncbi:MAG: aldehyde dehydrogenase family protein, partial [Ilumatobacteraceae bacterium]
MATRVIPHWINNSADHNDSGSTSPVWNPATGEVQAEVLLATQATVDAAVQAAATAFPRWSE